MREFSMHWPVSTRVGGVALGTDGEGKGSPRGIDKHVLALLCLPSSGLSLLPVSLNPTRKKNKKRKRFDPNRKSDNSVIIMRHHRRTAAAEARRGHELHPEPANDTARQVTVERRLEGQTRSGHRGGHTYRNLVRTNPPGILGLSALGEVYAVGVGVPVLRTIVLIRLSCLVGRVLGRIHRTLFPFFFLP
ncbi:hypothetical protein P170DRAFT_182961 [Aspergillus steynii IBT 23096]|uniref:Uncharacterized protein n=1 Tax=Aspergillus steynii IBT 23096 TaxID=1392250 RepID=A0A2I2G958_9EURO|nr:uncharacterized protein P170DRAFT_182961 [Aspergillus steynii IBT 23096]PLB49373.1 hypothetical protein P170DRAFT_182961 [Aspergillus steynii IBT 23096]